MAVLIGAIDAAVFFSFWLAIGVFVSDEPRQLLIVLSALILPALLVAWRGLIDVRLALAGMGSSRRAARDGFLCGALSVSTVWIWTFGYRLAHAAGNPWDDVSFSDPVSWLIILVPLVVSMMIGGGLGSLHGLVLFELNRRLVKVLAPGNSSAAGA
ncbi:MAG: hypothetical protein HYZ40_10165 [Rhodospirillales bacterium]|nr:hypothetical protein [Rhodospirillales bacterium]